MAHQIAVVSEHAVADVIEVDSLPELARRYRVTGVPKTLVNETFELLGSQTEGSILDALERARP